MAAIIDNESERPLPFSKRQELKRRANDLQQQQTPLPQPFLRPMRPWFAPLIPKQFGPPPMSRPPSSPAMHRAPVNNLGRMP